MSFETIAIEQDARGVATLTLNRPERHNALNAAMIAEVTEAARTLGADETVRLVVLTGAGPSFSAGGDFNWFADCVARDRAGRIEDSRTLADLFDALNTLPKALIGRINGQAFGGGTGLMAVCDYAVGLSSAKFGLTEVRLGLAPANISPYVMAKIGAGNARATMLSGALFDGARAAAIGLLTEAVDDEAALDARIEAVVADHLGASGQAVAATKTLIAKIAGMPPAATKELTAETLADVWDTEHGRIGIQCFLEKRRPPWRSGGAG